VQIEWDLQPAGLSVIEAEGTPLPARVIESIRTNRVALKGPLGTPASFRSVNVGLRVALGLYAAVRPCTLYPGVRSRYERADSWSSASSRRARTRGSSSSRERRRPRS
jgi:Isocitrate/isopropylmalate dehydrogenase